MSLFMCVGFLGVKEGGEERQAERTKKGWKKTR
jgi:hypothetical protein